LRSGGDNMDVGAGVISHFLAGSFLWWPSVDS